MSMYASVSGGIMVKPENVEITVPKMARLLSNDNKGETALQTPA